MENVCSVRTNSWLKIFDCERDDQSVVLFCFHHAGGAASMYRTWQKKLGAFAKVIAVQLPGRENRSQEPLLEDSCIIIDFLCDVISESLDGRPYIFFGHSLGASLSLHVIHELQRRGIRVPIGLIVSARSSSFVKSKAIDPCLYSDEEFLTMILKFNGVPKFYLREKEFLYRLLPRLRSDFVLSNQLHESQQNLDRLDMPIVAIGGIADPHCPPTDLNGWASYTTNNFRAISLPGDHFYIRSESLLLKHILQSINQFVALL
jgi:medium-chain acyl-[acyl-carrier-protein] hydrolase